MTTVSRPLNLLGMGDAYVNESSESSIQSDSVRARLGDSGRTDSASSYRSSYHYKVYGESTGSNCYVTVAAPPAVQEEDENDDVLVDWNEEFQQLVEVISSKTSSEDLLRSSYSSLSRLMQDFVHVCKSYAKILVHEKSLPLRHKTIKPAALGGFAGGTKYIHAGILFKFSSSDHFNLYGSDERAAKAALHELRASREVFEARVGISVPLLAVIDYCGHRILCSSILPLDYLVYGSSNGGKTVFASQDAFNEKMRLIGEKLNLQGHYAGSSPNTSEHKYLHAPCDIEGHIGNDGRSYVVDLHRLLPPEAPTRKNSTEFLYRLLRPEFVRSYPKPLSSDAFSKFETIDAAEHNEELRSATELLRARQIPKLGRYLDSLEGPNADNLRLPELLHRRGINLRHLGLVRASVTNSKIRKALLLEMVARSLKNDLNGILRHAATANKLPSNGPYKAAIVNFLNLVLSDSPTFWTTHIKQLLEEYYPGGLTTTESARTYSLRSDLLIPTAEPLLSRLQKITGVTLTPQVMSQLDADGLEMVVQDIAKLSTRVHSPDYVTSIEGVTLYIHSSKSFGPQAERLFDMALSKLEIAQSAAPGSTEAVELYGNALLERALLKSGPERAKLLRRAFDHFLSISDHERLFYFAKQLHQLAIDEKHSQERDKLFHVSSEAYKLALDLRKKLTSLATTPMKAPNASSNNSSNGLLPSSSTTTDIAHHLQQATLVPSSIAPSPALATTKRKPLAKDTSATIATHTSTSTHHAAQVTSNPPLKEAPRKFGDVIPVNVEAGRKGSRAPSKVRELSMNATTASSHTRPVSANEPLTPVSTATAPRANQAIANGTLQAFLPPGASTSTTTTVTVATTRPQTSLVSTPESNAPRSVISTPSSQPTASSTPSSQPGDPEYYLNWGDLYYELGKSKSGEAAKECFATAGNKYQQSWQEDPNLLLLRAAELNRQEVMSRIVESCIADRATSDLASVIAFFDSSPHLSHIDSRECPSLSDSVVHRIAAFQRIPPHLLRPDALLPPLLSQGFEVTQLRLSGTDMSDNTFQVPWPHLEHLEVRDCHRFTDLGLVWMSRFSTHLEVLNLSKCVVGNLKMSKNDFLERSSTVAPSLSLYFEDQIAIQLTQGSPSGSPLRSDDATKTANQPSSRARSNSNQKNVPPSPNKKNGSSTALNPSAPVPFTVSSSFVKNHSRLPNPTAKGVTDKQSGASSSASTAGAPSSSHAVTLSGSNASSLSDDLFVLSELHQMPKLTSLNLADCTSLTDMGLYYLVRKSPSLITLNISGCVGITTAGLVVIFQKRPSKSSGIGPARLVLDPHLEANPTGRTSRLSAFQAERRRFLEQQKRQLAETSENTASFFLWTEISPPSTSTPSSTPSSSSTSSPGSSRASSPTRTSSIGSAASARFRHRSALSGSGSTTNSGTNTERSQDTPPPTPARLSLQSLDLSGCARIEDEALIWASWACPSLSRLKLSRMPLLTTRSLHFILDNCPIRSLKLGKSSDLDDSVILKLASNCTDLEQFEVSMAKKVSPAALVTLIQSCPSLAVFNLSSMPQLDNAVLSAMAKNLPLIKSLKFSSLYRETDSAYHELGASLGKSLTVLHLDSCERISDSALSGIILPNNALRSLQLRDLKQITAAGVGESLSRCSSLTSFSLSKLALSTAAVKAMVEGLLAASASLNGASGAQRQLGSPVSLPQRGIGSNQRQRCGLLSLDLSWCKISNETALEPLFAICPSLTNLDLNETSIGSRTASAVSRHCLMLEYVNMASTKVSDEGVLDLLASCGHSLKFLKLAGCWKLSDVIVPKLAHSTPLLRYLNLGRVTKITHVRLIYSHCHSLNTLILDGLRSLTDDAVVPLILQPQTLPNLTHFQINGCSDISSSIIFQLRMARPGCAVYSSQK